MLGKHESGVCPSPGPAPSSLEAGSIFFIIHLNLRHKDSLATPAPATVTPEIPFSFDFTAQSQLCGRRTL